MWLFCYIFRTIEDATGLIPEEECQSEVDMQYSFTTEDNYGDGDTYSYRLVLMQPVASSGAKTPYVVLA